MTIAVSAIRRVLTRPRWPPTTITKAAVRQLHASAMWAAYKTLRPFKLADIGEGITECELIKWSVKPLTAVQMFDPLCEVQSDKASVELTSPFDGIIKELLFKEGDVAKVGEDLCIIEVESEGEAQDASAEAASTHESAPTKAQEVSVESKQQSTTATPPPASAVRALHPLDPRFQAQAVAVTPSSGPVEVLALPSVRHFAKQIGIDISVLTPGSGKGGRVERRDVEEFIARGSSVSAAQRAPTQTLETQKANKGDVVVELGRTRYAMWRAMEKSLEIPHFGYSTYLDLTSIHNLLPILSQHIPRHYLANVPEDKSHLSVNPAALYPLPPPPDVPSTGKYMRLTYLPILLKTLSRAMIEWPLFRSSITPRSPSSDNANANAKPTLTLRPHADISIALSTPTGLYTPTLMHTDAQSIYALTSRLAHVAALGRRVPSGLGPAEMPKAGGTITVSNVGAVGQGEFASPVLVPGGGVAIVAIGRARWVRQEEDEDVFEAFGVEASRRGEGRGRGKKRLRVGVSWSADHRVVEGAELAAFVECWRGYVEHPERLIADSV